MALRDELTGVKNKHAYSMAEEELRTKVASGLVKKYAFIVFDLNGLKYVNDTYGHKIGDEFIKKGCQIICEAFSHSPVYRIGGDEFVVIAQGKDLARIDFALNLVEAKNHENRVKGEVTIAFGMARGDGATSVNDVFELADANMYTKKKQMKRE